MKEPLIRMLRSHENDICDVWRERLSETTFFAGMTLVDETSNPVRLMLGDLIRVLEGKLPSAQTVPTIAKLRRFQRMGGWKFSLCQCTEIFLTGEVVVRRYARSHLDLTDAEFLELFESLNRACHQLIRFYTLRYCENCRSTLTTEQNDAIKVGKQ